MKSIITNFVSPGITDLRTMYQASEYRAHLLLLISNSYFEKRKSITFSPPCPPPLPILPNPGFLEETCRPVSKMTISNSRLSRRDGPQVSDVHLHRPPHPPLCPQGAGFLLYPVGSLQVGKVPEFAQTSFPNKGYSRIQTTGHSNNCKHFNSKNEGVCKCPVTWEGSLGSENQRTFL